MRMVRWMCGVKLKDKLPSKELRERLGVDDIALVLQQNRLRWYGHVLRKDDDDWVRKCMEHEVEGSRAKEQNRTVSCNLSLMACFIDINVSQGSVATYTRCGGIFNIHLTANLPQNFPVNFFNRLRFDQIMVVSLWPAFLAHPVVPTNVRWALFLASIVVAV